MGEIVLKGKGAAKGVAEGDALVVREAVAFWTDIDVNDGTIIDPKSSARGKSIADKIFVFPTGRGSTADPYGFYLLTRGGKGPKAVVNIVANPATVIGAIISHTPMVYKPDRDPLEIIETGDFVVVDGGRGTVVITKKKLQTFDK